jgi:type VI secretion system protein ImpA
MTSLPIDVELMLAPLETGAAGSGSDLRADFSSNSPYQLLRDARSLARTTERAQDKGETVDVPPADHWRAVLSAGQQVLAQESKDFEAAAWLTEALVRLHGLEGLAAGARLIEGLCERYWDDGFPRPDEEGLEVRVGPIGGLSGGSGVEGTVLQPLRRITLFRRADGSPVDLYLWQQAQEASALNEERQNARYAAGVPELGALEIEAGLDKKFLAATRDAAVTALEDWRSMDRALDQRLGSDAPSMRKVTDLLEQINQLCARTVVTEPGASVLPVSGHAESGDDAGTAAGVTEGSPDWNPVRTRETALDQLEAIAAFFERTEPHSPLGYTLRETVRRARMPLPELLQEVLLNDEARVGMLSRLGMRTEP